MKTQISTLHDAPPPWTEIPEFKSRPLPETIVTVKTGNQKQNAIISKVLNRHPLFRSAAARIYRRNRARVLNGVFWGNAALNGVKGNCE